MLAANPNDVRSLGHLGFCKFMTCAGEQAIPLLEKAIRLSPRDPSLYLWTGRIASSYHHQYRIDEAITWFEKSRQANPEFLPTRWLLASAYGLKNELKLAAAELAEALRLTGADRYLIVNRVRRYSSIIEVSCRAEQTEMSRDWFKTVFLAGLRKAGMPDE